MESLDERAPHPRPDHRRDAGLPRRQRLVVRQVHPPRRRPRLARGVPDQHAARASARSSSRCCPACASTRARAGARGGFVERLNEGTWLGHVAEHVALALQQVVGHDIRRGKTRGVKGQKGRYNIIYGYVDEQVGIEAGKLAIRLVNHLVEGDPDFEWEAERDAFITRAERTAFGPSTQAIVDEAVSRDIPWIRLNQHSLVQLGQGVHAKRIRATMTSETSSIAVDIASDKDLTTKLLGAAGLPVPKQGSVRTADGAVQVANRIGYPVVVKPLDGNHGRGVCLDLKDEEDVRTAFVIAAEQSRRGVVIVRVDGDRQGLPLPDHRRPDGRDRRARARQRDRRRRLDHRAARRPRPTPTRDAAWGTRRC